ncbi:MAG: putative manganese-dependent inorganic diphosphatase [Solobacterium sp.]|jgi:manganese-dependent inorganic pyrophosphatase|nr:putative manganese-dependent inorganic diphosphatase [Solobacterium sp.]MCH4206369.1 putative manganese-dependent inorganic diphosphatase [Solobacterium sp.]MCH4227871.1 putative manganese-dependent inorganic diphosphatase [Solobacterium sp.]MCH4283237.1 putative manganese-dependent inorganic diphosphatase [Solobacterium sp.]
MDAKEKIYVTGHIHPDTDSIASAIGYAFFKKAQGINAVPCRLGKINHETDYLLKRFHFEEPMLLKDARKTLAEIELDPPDAISEETTIYETIKKMQETHRPAFCVTNADGAVEGIVTKSNLSNISLGDTASGIDLLRETSIEHIAETINGTIVYRDEQVHINGKVSIIALTSSKLDHYEIQDRIVIVGDDAQAQKELIRKGAGILIAVWTKEIQPEVIATAKEYHCPLILSGHGSMNTSRYIYFAPPVKLVMTKKLIMFHINDLAEDAGRKMMSSRYRTYPVIDANGKLQGYVSQYNIINAANKKIIMVDHNEFSQSVQAIEKAQLVEVVDHHRICDFSTVQPVSFRNEIVGATATIIATMFRENQIPIPENLAALLLSAILSDTLLFQSPTCTAKDRSTANILAALAGLDIDAFGRQIIEQQADTGAQSLIEQINQDIKSYEINSIQVIISQVMTASLSDVQKKAEEIQEQINEYADRKEMKLLLVAFTSLLDQGSILFAAGENAGWVSEAFPEQDEPYGIQKGLLSRKSQIVPKITEIINRYA